MFTIRLFFLDLFSWIYKAIGVDYRLFRRIMAVSYTHLNLGKNKELFSNIGKIGFRSAAFAISSILISLSLIHI